MQKEGFTMQTYKIAVIAGDGIGPDVIDEGKKVLAGIAKMDGSFKVEFTDFPWGCEYYLREGKMMPEDGLSILKDFDAIYLGAVGYPGVPDDVSLQGLLLKIRKGFDEYINLRPVKLLKGAPCPLKDVKEEDIDKDGVIRMMRIKTPYGAWKKAKDDPAIMELRSPSDSEGDFYDIYPEGMLENFDGDENLKTRKEAWGLDFNRNFPYGWFPEPRQDGAGDYPLSNVETKAIVDFVLAHPNIGGAAIGHTSGGIILYPPGTRASEKAPADDIKILKAIAEMGEEELGYKPLNIFDSFISSQEAYDSGALDDWMYETQGIPAYTMEFWDVAGKAGAKKEWGEKKETVKDGLERFALIMKWVKENAPEYFVDWKPYDHPDFSDVEIGGFNYKFTHQNPPEKFLLDEVEHDTKFNIRFLKAMPKLVIDEVKKEKVTDDVYKIEAIVGNTGYLSTALTDLAVNNNYCKPVNIVIEGGELIEGKKCTEIKELQGYSKTQTGVYFYGNITTFANASSRKKLSWIVKAKEGSTIRICASQVKAGKAEAEITL